MSPFIVFLQVIVLSLCNIIGVVGQYKTDAIHIVAQVLLDQSNATKSYVSMDDSIRLFSSFHAINTYHIHPVKYHLCRFQSNNASALPDYHDSFVLEKYNKLYAKLNIHVMDITLDRFGQNMTDHYQEDFLNFYCASRIGKALFDKQRYQDVLIVINAHFVITNKQFLSHFTFTKHDFLCAPSVSNTMNRLVDGCAWDLFGSRVALQYPLWLYVRNALETGMISLSHAITGGIQALSIPGIRILSGLHIVRAGRYSLTTTADNNNPAHAIEFDGYHHHLQIQHDAQGCYPDIHIEWPHFHTIPAIRMALEPITQNETFLAQFLACVARQDVMQKNNVIEQMSSPPPPQQHQVESIRWEEELFDLKYGIPTTTMMTIGNNGNKGKEENLEEENRVKIYDLILFFDELNMLELRLQMLFHVVDLFVLVESRYTFTGKPKPLFFSQVLEVQAARFAPYRDKILILVLDDLPHLPPTLVGHVWANEYYSRNVFDLALQSIPVHDWDGILIADVDEIPYPETVQEIRVMFQFAHYQSRFVTTRKGYKPWNGVKIGQSSSDVLLGRLYKLLPRDFLYSFDCNIEDRLPYGKVSITAITVNASRTLAKQLDRAEMKEHLTISRSYFQYLPYIPLQYVLSHRALHLSFFRTTLESMKTKLESYSHQNYAKDFYIVEEEEESGQTQGNDEAKKKKNAIEYRNEDALPQGIISLEAIQQRIQAGQAIHHQLYNGQEKRCEVVRLDETTERMKSVWEEIIARQ